MAGSWATRGRSFVSDNPYAPLGAQCIVTPPSGLLRELKSQSTWRLLGLGIITLGTYYVHYCARQSRIINQHLGRNSIPSFLVISLYVLSYASLVLLVGYFLVDEGHPAAIASDSADKLWTLFVLIWGFYARNRVNGLASFASDDLRWISGLWTFLFSPLYFNYKINVINEATIAAQAVA